MVCFQTDGYTIVSIFDIYMVSPRNTKIWMIQFETDGIKIVPSFYSYLQNWLPKLVKTVLRGRFFGTSILLNLNFFTPEFSIFNFLTFISNSPIIQFDI